MHSVLLVSALLLAAFATCTESGQAVDVFLIGGQSNATGQGYLRHLPNGVAPDPKVMLFHSNQIHSGGKAMAWIPLRGASESPDRFGPELGFGNRMAQLQPHRRIAIIKHAYSGSNLYKDWHPGANAADTAHFGPHFARFVETVDAGLAALKAKGLAPRIRAMLWQQGEGDASAKAPKGTAQRYAANLTHFIRRVRKQFAAPDMLFAYGHVLPVGSGPLRAAVRQAQTDLSHDSGGPAAVPGALLVHTDGLSLRANDPETPYPWDKIHFGTAGTLELGHRFAQRIHQADGRTAPPSLGVR